MTSDGLVIFHAVVNLGFGSYVVANTLNSRNIKTKRGTSRCRATSVRVILRNPIYTGRMKTPEGLTEPFEQYRIIDDEIFQKASDKLSSRDPNKEAERSCAQRIPKGNRGLLNGIIYCALCGDHLCLNHYSQKRRLADGTLCVYERDVYRCYTRLYNNNGCQGRVSYKADVIEANILMIVHRYFASIRKMPTATILKNAMAADTSLLTQAYQQAKKALE